MILQIVRNGRNRPFGAMCCEFWVGRTCEIMAEPCVWVGKQRQKGRASNLPFSFSPASAFLPPPSLLFFEAFDTSKQTMVNVPKTRRTYCRDRKCQTHTLHKVTQYKAGKASLFAQGA